MGLLNWFRNLFKKKPTPWEQKLLDDWEAGRVLQVDRDIDNKKLMETNTNGC
jgi:hypothetical protein